MEKKTLFEYSLGTFFKLVWLEIQLIYLIYPDNVGTLFQTCRNDWIVNIIGKGVFLCVST